MIIILGGSGFVANRFKVYLSSIGEEYTAVSKNECDYTNMVVLSDLLYRLKPSLVINCAGYVGKNVDYCEDDQDRCMIANAILPVLINSVMVKHKIPWIHVSSGCIYQGDETTPFSETDTPNFDFEHKNCSFYSGTKAVGESYLTSNENNCYICRLRIPFNEHKLYRNYITKLITYPTLVHCTNSISNIDEFCKAAYTLHSIEAPYGIYNITNPGYISAKECTDIIKTHGLKDSFNFFKTYDEFLSTVRAPRSNCVLDTSKLQSAGIHLMDVHESFDRACNLYH